MAQGTRRPRAEPQLGAPLTVATRMRMKTNTDRRRAGPADSRLGGRGRGDRGGRGHRPSAARTRPCRRRHRSRCQGPRAPPHRWPSPARSAAGAPWGGPSAPRCAHGASRDAATTATGASTRARCGASPPARGAPRELGYVIGSLDRMALRRQLTASRMPALFRTSAQHPVLAAQALPRRRRPRDLPRQRAPVPVLPRPRAAAPAAGELQEGQHLHGACVKGTGGARAAGPGSRACSDEMMQRSVAPRAGFIAWEYYFNFGGGRPPWISGMAQATGIQAFGRASQLLGEPQLPRPRARDAFGAFQSRAAHRRAHAAARGRARTTCSTRSPRGCSSSTRSCSR